MKEAAKASLEFARDSTGCQDEAKLHAAAKAMGRVRVFEQEAGLLLYRAEVLEKSEGIE
jgi:hypothetical protein